MTQSVAMWSLSVLKGTSAGHGTWHCGLPAKLIDKMQMSVKELMALERMPHTIHDGYHHNQWIFVLDWHLKLNDLIIVNKRDNDCENRVTEGRNSWWFRKNFSGRQEAILRENNVIFNVTEPKSDLVLYFVEIGLWYDTNSARFVTSDSGVSYHDLISVFSWRYAGSIPASPVIP